MKINEKMMRNTIYGAIIGDALGVPVEFKDRDWLKENPVTTMQGYGTYCLPKGSWSDDTSMTLCLADSIGTKKTLDYEDIMERFESWLFYHKYTPDGKTFDCGNTCSNSIEKHSEGTDALLCGGTEGRENGNGSLMRISPVPFILISKYGEKALSDDKHFELIHNISKLTHGHPVSLLGCDIYCAFMITIISGCSKENLQKQCHSIISEFLSRNRDIKSSAFHYDRLFQNYFKDLPEDSIRSTGYVVDTLEAAIWCFLTTDNYKDCVLKAVNLGSDTDSVACVAGSIAGLYYNEVPSDWLESLRNKDFIEEILCKFWDGIN